MFPPDYFPPASATDFFISGNSPGLVAPSAVTQLGADVQLPGASRGVIRDVTIGISNMTATTVAVWRILIDGGPAAGGWGALTLAPRAAAFVSASFLPESTRILIPAGSRVQLCVELQVAAAPCDLSGQLHGWFWPEDNA